MKATFILIVSIILLSGCKKEYCWDFKITTSIQYQPGVSTDYYENTFVECGITDKEAKIVADSYTKVTKQSIGGQAITTTTNCSYSKH